MHRNSRQEAILEIINEMEVETQEELCMELMKKNFKVTQATISRDIKDLKLYKVSGSVKKYKYAYIESEGDGVTSKMHNLFRECVQSITNANNLVVIKTIRANASTAGLFIDSMAIKHIVGTIAGDDTLLIIADTNESAVEIVLKLKEYLK